MTYREPPQPEPLILALKTLLVAMNPDTGEKLWEKYIDDSAERLFLLQGVVFVAYGEKMLIIDPRTGKELNTVELPFRITAGLVREGKLHVCGSTGAACITSGGIEWFVRYEREKGQSQGWLVCRDRSSQELWRVMPGESYIGVEPGMMLGTLVAQPDLDRW